MAKTNRGRLADAGYQRLPGPLRHYRAPDGKEVSYRQAFRAARGESLERAVRQPGKFSDELRTASRVRELARFGELVDRGVATPTEEREIAGKTLRQLTRGHYRRETVGEVQRGKRPERESAYGRLLAALHEDAHVEARPNETGPSVERRLDEERRRINAPDGKKARLLVALGYRDAGADYDVGETP